MPAYKVAVFDHTDQALADVARFVAACQVYVDHWLAPFYPEMRGTTIRHATAANPPMTNEAWLTIAPTTSVANSLGYHQMTAAGLPLGIVEMDACRKYNMAWQIPGTHELAEMLRNDKLRLFRSYGRIIVPEEICDAVTSDHFDIDGVQAANAVTPAWFDADAPAGARFDVMGLVKGPIVSPAGTLVIPRGGWLEWNVDGSYTSAYGPDMAPDMIAYMREHVGRRQTIKMSPADHDRSLREPWLPIGGAPRRGGDHLPIPRRDRGNFDVVA